MFAVPFPNVLVVGPRRATAGQFGDGYGVRKDTYLDRAPGDRRLRVAEVRDTSHLERMQKLL